MDAADAIQDVEEDVLWRGTWAARLARRRAAGRVAPLQRLVQTRLAWPLVDAYRSGGDATKTAIASTAVAAILGAAGAGVALGPRIDGEAPSEPIASVDSVELAGATGPATTLRGVAPDFDAGESVAAAERKATARPLSPPAATPAEVEVDLSKAPPAEVAYRFAQAFARYEVGRVDELTAATLAAAAEKPLADALATEPPRLPAGAEVPKAEVLNVVLAEREGDEVEASISLTRLEAASELRLTLRRTPEGWQVAEVLG